MQHNPLAPKPLPLRVIRDDGQDAPAQEIVLGVLTVWGMLPPCLQHFSMSVRGRNQKTALGEGAIPS